MNLNYFLKNNDYVYDETKKLLYLRKIDLV